MQSLTRLMPKASLYEKRLGFENEVKQCRTYGILSRYLTTVYLIKIHKLNGLGWSLIDFTILAAIRISEGGRT